MKEIVLNVSYTPAQKEIFFNQSARFITIEKGRRFGFTRGAANFCIEMLLEGKNILWVDTITSNLQRYYERYFLPVLKQLDTNMYKFGIQDKKLSINLGDINSYLDMRSAERPENIEGFGYDIVILNEAGIILNDAYLWDNAISPMLLDNPNSRAFIGGVPKGMNKFYELAMRGMKGQSDWINLQYSSFDNPMIDKAEIERLIDELGGQSSNVVRQEIYGEFLDGTSNKLFGVNMIELAFRRERYFSPDDVRVWGVDVAREGDDKSVLVKRSGFNIDEIIKRSNLSTSELARFVYKEYLSANIKPDVIFIDSVGIGAGVFDTLIDLGLRGVVRQAKSSFVADDENKYANKRAEMYFNLANSLNKLSIKPDESLKRELSAIEFGFDNKERYFLLPKKDIKKTLGFSPDTADALALCFYEKINKIAFDEKKKFNHFNRGFGW